METAEKEAAGTQLPGIQYSKLSALAAYIIKHKLPEAAELNLAEARQLKLPLLNQLKHISEEDIHRIFLDGTQKFLEHLANGTTLQDEEIALKNWQNDRLDGFRRNEIKGADITLVYSARKRVLLKYAAAYTQDPQLLIELVTEGEQLFSHLELRAYQMFSKIQHEEMVRLNMRLQEYQEELQVTNEELRESHEELLVTNEDLREQVKRREAAEETLERERNFLEAVLENIADGIVACNEKGELIFFNAATQEFHGLPQEKTPPSQWADKYNLYDADGKTPLATDNIPLFRAFRGEVVENQEMVIAPKNGLTRTLLASGKQIKNKEGELLGAVVAMHDITTEKEAKRILQEANRKLEQARLHLENTNLELERRVQLRTDELTASEEEIRQSLENAVELNRALEERENFLSSIIEQTPVSTWIADSQGTQIQVNEACLNLFGVSDPDVGIKKYNILEDNVIQNQPYYKDIERVFSQGIPTTFEASYNLSDVEHISVPGSKPVYLKVTIFPIKNAKGKVTNAVIQHEDISERKNAELALKESETLFRTIANASPVALWMTDEHGQNNFVNKTWVEWTGRPQKQQLGSGWMDSILDDDREKVLKNFTKDFTARQSHSAEFRMLDATGCVRWCLIEGVPRYQADGTFAGFVGSCVDITEQKEAEDLLRSKNDELQRINADLDSFIYTASHDLKSPIASIEGLTNILEKKLDNRMDEKERSVMEMIGISVARFKKTINGLTDITKVQKDLDSKIEDLQFSEVLEDVRQDLEELLTEAGGTFEQDLQVSQVTFARNNLRSVIYNLLSNAIKYRSAERPLLVKVCTYQANDELVLSIEDNGLGLNKLDQAKLFTMFKRLHSHVEGTGIGLYMIKRIIENRGGRITVDSSEGKGTCFKVFFPQKFQNSQN
jgi:PAS domain S-box-containing protein